MTPLTTGPRWHIVVASLLLWLIWGSTYLAILYAIATLPMFLMAGARFLIAGLALCGFALLRGAALPTARQWRSAAVVGAMLMLVGNGGVVWAESRVPTGLAALLVATVPLWMVILEALGPGGVRPSKGVTAGVALGLVGVGLLMEPTGGERSIDPLGALSLLAAALCWSVGSLYSRRADLPSSPQMAIGSEMLCGGTMLVLAGVLHGEPAKLALANVTAQSWLAFGYLVVAGSLIGFSAYIFLLRRTAPALATTYAYVNPVIAVLLGWAFVGERITGRTIVAMAVIVGAVLLITTQGVRGSRQRIAVELDRGPERAGGAAIESPAECEAVAVES